MLFLQSPIRENRSKTLLEGLTLLGHHLVQKSIHLLLLVPYHHLPRLLSLTPHLRMSNPLLYVEVAHPLLLAIPLPMQLNPDETGKRKI